MVEVPREMTGVANGSKKPADGILND